MFKALGLADVFATIAGFILGGGGGGGHLPPLGNCLPPLGLYACTRIHTDNFECSRVYSLMHCKVEGIKVFIIQPLSDEFIIEVFLSEKPFDLYTIHCF